MRDEQILVWAVHFLDHWNPARARPQQYRECAEMRSNIQDVCPTRLSPKTQLRFQKFYQAPVFTSWLEESDIPAAQAQLIDNFMYVRVACLPLSCPLQTKV